MSSYSKVKSVAKNMMVRSAKLDTLVHDTMQTVSALVGATLGPGGHPVLIERQEINLPNMVTKDGVTVMKSLGFTDPTRHAIMESARDASVRTANEAGDGTTTATILAYSVVKYMHDYCKANPAVSPQKVIRRLETYFKNVIEPTVRQESIKCDTISDHGRRLLWNVAKLSANGDAALADTVMKCFDIVGDNGNVTITEINGASAYEVEKIDGFPMQTGYEDSCVRYAAQFINDPGNQRVVLEKPVFVLYHGRITEIQSVIFLMEAIGAAWQNDGFNHNVVLVANGFSDSVLGQLALNFSEQTTINVFPLLAPMNAMPNSQLDFLRDVSAITGAAVFDPITKPFPRTHEDVDLNDLGHGVTTFEAQRFRSNIVGQCDEVLVLERVDVLQKQLEQNSESILESTLLQERIGKLTGGIARLKVIGASNGELREKRDRAEDAVMAVRKAIEQGCLPGGGWTLVKLVVDIWKTHDDVLIKVLAPALIEPFFVLFRNLGYTDGEIREQFLKPVLNGIDPNWRLYYPHQFSVPWWKKLFGKNGREVDPALVAERARVYDAMEGKFVDAVEGGILDSTPAVLEAIRNSLSIATLLGTLGGTVVYYRDPELERQEAREANEFLRNANTETNPADERA